jgi:hypothetical protein
MGTLDLQISNSIFRLAQDTGITISAITRSKLFKPPGLLLKLSNQGSISFETNQGIIK